ncbi:paralemmin 1a isoform X5 [Toxotes jaculatrix]|uniref:paralemmin 1a isoform X5 n=1 Tax=Toxotes jaculatrix TaxID=941984 RepID=UPI001B3AC331|nr:paralemmin 1a isoform X5 [Toxotes jaculatrix]
MEVSQAVCQQDRLQLLAEKRKWQTEIENKKRQLEDDKRALQHLKSKALRERWLLDGAPAADLQQDEIQRQLEQDEAKTRSLEDTISRLEQELVRLETGAVCQTITHTTASSGPAKAAEVKGHSNRQQDSAAPLGEVVQVVHEMNGEDVHLLSSSEVDELIHKADEASMMSQTDALVTSRPKVEEPGPKPQLPEPPCSEPPRVAMEITGLEAKPHREPNMAEASAENPVTMVFMGYQSVEDEAETKKVLGLQGTVKAELVLIDDPNGKMSPGGGGKEESSDTAQTAAPPPPVSKPAVATTASNGETAGEVAGEVEGGVEEIKKKKQPCKCCSIM